MSSLRLARPIVVAVALLVSARTSRAQALDPATTKDSGIAAVAAPVMQPLAVTLASAESATHATVRDTAFAMQDTVPRRRAKAVEVSDAYELRLRIHRYASYTMIPLFITQTVAGNQLYVGGGTGPDWAKTLHSGGAFALGTLFTVNTVTGLWNLWESRDNEVGRTKRIIHSVLLLASDAGFTYDGISGGDAKRSQDARNRHRNTAFVSMGAALVGYGVMLVGDH